VTNGEVKANFYLGT